MKNTKKGHGVPLKIHTGPLPRHLAWLVRKGESNHSVVLLNNLRPHALNIGTVPCRENAKTYQTLIGGDGWPG